MLLESNAVQGGEDQCDVNSSSSFGSVREVYGIRRIVFNEKERTLRVEYDASRLSEAWSPGCCEVPDSIY